MTQHPLVSRTTAPAQPVRPRAARTPQCASCRVPTTKSTRPGSRPRPLQLRGLYTDDRALSRWSGERRLARGRLGARARVAARGLQQVCASTARASSACWSPPAASGRGWPNLAARVARGLGSGERRTIACAGRTSATRQATPWRRRWGCSIAGLERASAILLSGRDVRREVRSSPTASARASVRVGTKVAFVNPRPWTCASRCRQPHSKRARHGQHLAPSSRRHYARVAAPHRLGWPRRWRVSRRLQTTSAFATMLSQASCACAARCRWRAARVLRRDPSLAAALAEVTGARLGYLPEGAKNAVRASLAGATPHRGVADGPLPSRARRGRHDRCAAAWLPVRRRSRVGGPRAVVRRRPRLRQAADCVVALTPYASRASGAPHRGDPAGGGLRGDLRDLGERRRPLAERPGCGTAARRSASRLEGAGVLGNLRAPRIRVPELRGRARRAAAANSASYATGGRAAASCRVDSRRST